MNSINMKGYLLVCHIPELCSLFTGELAGIDVLLEFADVEILLLPRSVWLLLLVLLLLLFACMELPLLNAKDDVWWERLDVRCIDVDI